MSLNKNDYKYQEVKRMVVVEREKERNIGEKKTDLKRFTKSVFNIAKVILTS